MFEYMLDPSSFLNLWKVPGHLHMRSCALAFANHSVLPCKQVLDIPFRIALSIPTMLQLTDLRRYVVYALGFDPLHGSL